jgi:hypothetical protein
MILAFPMVTWSLSIVAKESILFPWSMFRLTQLLFGVKDFEDMF